MTFKLVVSDLDGTLLTPEHRVGDYSLRVLRTLRDRGVGLVLASGRHFLDVRAISEVLGGGTCTISSNGAAVYDGDGAAIEMEAIDADCLEFLTRDPAFDGVHTNLFRPNDWLVERPEPRLLEYHAESGFSYRVVSFRDLDEEPVVKVFFYGEHEHLLGLEDLVLARCSERVTTTFSLPVTLEVMAKGVSKGAALARECARRGLDLAESIAFGDGLNDVEMLRTAGLGVLMGNADPRLMAALPTHPVTGANGDEAVARHLAGLYPKHWFD